MQGSPTYTFRREPSSLEIRTTNGAESYHFHQNQQFYTHHPNIFVLMDTLVKLPNETYVKVRGMSVDFTKTDSKFALEAEADLRIGEISRLEFVLILMCNGLHDFMCM